MGTAQFSTTIFEKLYNDKHIEISTLFTQPDKKVGRKQILTAPHIKQFCKTNDIDIDIYQPTNPNDKRYIELIKDIKPDFIIVASYAKILSQEILDIAPCINLHTSILPKYRGASPIQTAILNNDKYTGTTAMYMAKGLDSGEILSTAYIKIEQKDDISSLFDKLSVVSADLILYVLKNFQTILPKKQQPSQATYCGKISKNDAIVSFDDSSKLFQKYKAYKFWPEIHTKNSLKIKSCDILDRNSLNKSGVILEISKDGITVGCKKGSIKIYQLQAPSKKAINATDYTRGKRLSRGDIFG